MNAKQYAVLVNDFYSVAKSLQVDYEIEIENSDEDFQCLSALFLWSRILALLSPTEQGQAALRLILTKAKNESNFLFDVSMADFILHHVHACSSPVLAHRFTSVYLFKLLLSDQDNAVSLLQHEVDNPNSEFWRYSSGLFRQVLDCAGLIDRGKVVVSLQCEENEFQSFVATLEAVLASKSLNSRFAVLISDECVNFLHSASQHLSAAEYLLSEEATFQETAEALLHPQTAYPNLARLLACAHLRVFCEKYSKLALCDHFDDPETLRSLTLANRVILRIPSLQLFVLKLLMQGRNLQNLISLCQGKKWLSWALFYFEFKELSAFLSDESRRVYIAVAECIVTREYTPAFDEILDILGTAEANFAFGLAFLQHIFIRKWFGENNCCALLKDEDFVRKTEAKIGSCMTRFILMLATAFPKGSLLELTPDKSEEEFYQTLVLAYLLLISLSHTQYNSPITNVFFQASGNVWPGLSQRVDTAFLCGMPENPVFKHLRHLHSNFEQLKNARMNLDKHLGSATRCSLTCPYVYITDEPNGPTLVKKCPYCNSLIGGKDGKWLEREGHVNMSDAEALDFLEETITLNQLAPETGFWMRSVDTEISVRGLDGRSQCLLHLMLTTTLYFIEIAGLGDSQVNVQSEIEADCSSGYLPELILTDCAALSEFVSFSDNFIWWFSLLTSIRGLISRHQNKAGNLEDREALESDFQEATKSYWQDPASILGIVEEKQEKSATALQSLLSETTDLREFAQYPILCFFRLRASPTEQKLENDFASQELQENYPLLNLSLIFSDEISSLQLLLLLVDFTNDLRERFNRRIWRAAAKVFKMVDVLKGDSRMREMYLKIVDLWNNYAAAPMSFEGKSLNAKELKGESEDVLADFLVDKKDGVYMLAAMKMLGETQNSMIEAFLSVQAERRNVDRAHLTDSKPIPIQDIRPDSVLSVSITAVSSTGTYLNNPDYGKGHEVVLNYPRLEEAVIEGFSKGKLLEMSSFVYVQYQFELLSSSSKHCDLITTIRKLVPQQSFTDQERQEIHHLFACKSTDTPETHMARLTNLFKELEALLCYIPTMLPGATSIQDFALKLAQHNICDSFMGASPWANFTLERVISVYESLESALFPYIKFLLLSEFCFEWPSAVEWTQAMSYNCSIPKSDVSQALMRLIVRIVLGGVDARQYIADYITRADLWRADISMEMVMKLAESLKQTPLACALALYEHLDMKVQEEQRPRGTETKLEKKKKKKGKKVKLRPFQESA